MFPGQEQIANIYKSSLQMQLDAMNNVAQKMFAGVEKIVALNMAATKQAISDHTDTVQKLIHAKGPQDFMALSGSVMKPTAEKAVAYSQQLAGISAAITSDLGRDVAAHATQAQGKVMELVETAKRNAPANVESVVAMVKNVASNAAFKK